jgi:hypothetical protein
LRKRFSTSNWVACDKSSFANRVENGATILSIMTFSLKTLGIMTFRITIKYVICFVMLNVLYAECHSCCVTNMPFMFSVFMLNVDMLSVIMLIVIAPIKYNSCRCYKNVSLKMSNSKNWKLGWQMFYFFSLFTLTNK